MPTIHIDGKDFPANPAHNMLQAALSHGFDLPYFCWHPALGSVGACRQCAVRQYRDENDRQGQIVMACMLPAKDGTRIAIADPEAAEFRASVIEWLMTNHPHDCPVCDEGGECHLQDMTVMTGHCQRRYTFRKRTFRNQQLGPFINHEMNRCIECYRCVRFYNDYAGGRDLGVFGAHNHVYFGRHADGVLESEFSGNLVEVCPTGVFTDKTLKHHYSRKWDMQSAPAVCAHCAVGCNILAAGRYGAVRRILNRFHGDINGYFLCDRGRFGYAFANNPDRPRQPRVRAAAGAPAAPASAAETLAAVDAMLAEAAGIIGIGSPRASLESNYALRSLVGAANFSPGCGATEAAALDALLAAMQAAPGGPASVADADQADAVLVLGEDPSNTAPRLALALRQAVRQEALRAADALRIPAWHDRAARDFAQDRRGPMFIAWPAATRLDDIATATCRAAPADIVRLGRAVAHALDPSAPAVADLDASAAALADRIAAALRGAQRPLVVTGTSLNTPALIAAAAGVVHALHSAGNSGARLAAIAPEANSIGAAMLGGPSIDALAQRLQAGAADTLVIIENDLHRRLPGAAVEQIRQAAKRIIVIDTINSPISALADVVLPAATFAEAAGTYVNHEGRAQRSFHPLPPQEAVLPAWRWLGRLAMARAAAVAWDNLDAVLAALAADYPHLAGARAAAPDATHRIVGRVSPRSPRRFSGRTSMLAHLGVHEPKPPQDADTPMSFSMEGHAGQPPPALLSHYWAPGWNSVQALNRFQDEVGGQLHGGNPGVRLLVGGCANGQPAPDAIPPAFQPDQGTLLAVPLYAVFGSEELSAAAPVIAERASAPVITMGVHEARRRDLCIGQTITIEVDGQRCTAPLHLDESLPAGIVGLAAGRCGIPTCCLPAMAVLAK
jgi:NADH-quinone oxidoreductase subunit G